MGSIKITPDMTLKHLYAQLLHAIAGGPGVHEVHLLRDAKIFDSPHDTPFTKAHANESYGLLPLPMREIYYPDYCDRSVYHNVHHLRHLQTSRDLEMTDHKHQNQNDNVNARALDCIVDDDGGDMNDEAVVGNEFNEFESTEQSEDDSGDLDTVTSISNCEASYVETDFGDTVSKRRKPSVPISVSVRILTGDVIYGPATFDAATYIWLLKYDVGPFLGTASAYFDFCHNGCVLDTAMTLGLIVISQELELLAIRKSKCREHENLPEEGNKPLAAICNQEEEEEIEDLPKQEMLRDQLLGAKIRVRAKDACFFGVVEAIHVGMRTGERLYFIRYEDCDVEHMIRSAVVKCLI